MASTRGRRGRDSHGQENGSQRDLRDAGHVVTRQDGDGTTDDDGTEPIKSQELHANAWSHGDDEVDELENDSDFDMGVPQPMKSERATYSVSPATECPARDANLNPMQDPQRYVVLIQNGQRSQWPESLFDKNHLLALANFIGDARPDIAQQLTEATRRKRDFSREYMYWLQEVYTGAKVIASNIQVNTGDERGERSNRDDHLLLPSSVGTAAKGSVEWTRRSRFSLFRKFLCNTDPGYKPRRDLDFDFGADESYSRAGTYGLWELFKALYPIEEQNIILKHHALAFPNLWGVATDDSDSEHIPQYGDEEFEEDTSSEKAITKRKMPEPRPKSAPPMADRITNATVSHSTQDFAGGGVVAKAIVVPRRSLRLKKAGPVKYFKNPRPYKKVKRIL
ncbi:hypothetical protein AURDEDRAFT_176712 [Auricularia subglabra TFB-10046 SS5]|uniref:Uncharacterized protein n=1 Tax=Auricularia subglabra (strain TFB-10046 / SS5) TaxID=717982 RepID=J0LCJ8_AURST|nr:hypothetical protein AURDEDRAFT_176712 [Auricularia subglabra TFB-10046 SS5]